MDARAQIKEFIHREIVGDSPAPEFRDDESLISLGILDSLGMLKLIAFLDEEMNTNIMAEDFRLEDFETLDLICGWIDRHGEGAAGDQPEPAGTQTAPSLSPTTKMPSVTELTGSAIDPGLRDRVVLVTGASRGLGETIGKLFSAYGSKVVINYSTNEDHARRVAAEIEAAGGKAMVARADVSDESQVNEMIDKIRDTWGTIDVLVNNAANDVTPKEFSQLTWSEVQDSLNVILRGAFNCCKAAIPLMTAAGHGKIVNIGSLATDHPASNQLKYVVAKSALVGLTRSLAVDFAPHNIQVNLVSPSVVETDLISHIPEAFRTKIAQDTPMRRNASPEDVAQAAVYLASNHSRFMTGQKIMVTGGAAPFL